MAIGVGSIKLYNEQIGYEGLIYLVWYTVKWWGFVSLVTGKEFIAR